MDHNRQKKIAVIGDLTGFGRCSLTVSVPVISKLKIQCCPVPTAILSNHTAFRSCFIHDFTDHFLDYTSEWKKLGLKFSGIYTGYLGSREQFAYVTDFIRNFRTEKTIITVDPVMGDNGRAYRGFSNEMFTEMKSLISLADIITPNLTEACILTDTPYKDSGWRMRDLDAMIRKLGQMGPGKIVITGIPQGNFIANLSFEGGNIEKITRQYRIGDQRFGTGDIFASVIAADAVNGIPFALSVRRASRFVRRCILKSIEMELPQTDGVAFEEVLNYLR